MPEHLFAYIQVDLQHGVAVDVPVDPTMPIVHEVMSLLDKSMLARSVFDTDHDPVDNAIEESLPFFVVVKRPKLSEAGCQEVWVRIGLYSSCERERGLCTRKERVEGAGPIKA
jgi:hypothetical protein